eukprot:m.135427 g.135427  ORF g.135427 m.135427 type:complete len:54 (+) comp20161_c2_seq6:67-228(+)
MDIQSMSFVLSLTTLHSSPKCKTGVPTPQSISCSLRQNMAVALQRFHTGCHGY